MSEFRVATVFILGGLAMMAGAVMAWAGTVSL